MGGASCYEELRVWQLARALSLQIHQQSRRSRLGADRELARQLNGASLSVVANIAEGFTRRRDKEFIQFLRIAQGSNGEVRALLYVAGDRGYLDRQTIDRFVAQTSSIGRMIRRLELYLETCIERSPRPRRPKDPRT